MRRESLAKAESSPTHQNGSSKDPIESFFDYSQSKNLETNKVFPSEPVSAYISSYFPESYDFPYNPDPLVGGNNYKIYDEMKSDDQVKSAISFKKDQILAPGWQIKCEDKEIIETLEENLKNLATSFEDSLRDILSAFEYGFSMTECVYERSPDGFIMVKDLKTRPPHGFEFHLNDKGDVEKIVQNASSGTLDFKPDYFLHHVYQPQFGNPFGRSDLQAAHTAWKAKKFIFRFWAMYVERFAAPTVVAEYPEEFDQNKVARLQAIVNTIQNSTNLVVPAGAKLDFKMANRDSANIYENALTLLNTMIARAVLMPDLMGVSGEQTSGGSYALGETQFDLFIGMVKREQEALSRRITNKIIKPLVRANWGDVEAEFQFKAYSQKDAMEANKLWVEATKAKIWDPTEDEIKHLLEGLKFPVPESIEINKDEPMDPLNPLNQNNSNGSMNPENKSKPPFPTENPDNLAPPKKEEAQDKEFSSEHFHQRIYRMETKFEKQLNFADIKKSMDKTEDTAYSKLKTLAIDIYADFIAQIKDRNLLGRFKPELINDLGIHHLKPMNQEFKSFMKGTFMNSYNMAQKEILPRSDKKFAMSEDLLPEELLEIIEAEAFKIVGDYSVHVTNKLRNELVQGIKNGLPERELLNSLKELGSEETEKWLKTVIRTKTTEMFNRGRKSYWDTDPIAKQIVDAYQFSAIIDDRTSEVCRELDGKVFSDKEYVGRIVPPLHFNCRSVLVPITKFEEYETDKEVGLDKLKDMGGNLIV